MRFGKEPSFGSRDPWNPEKDDFTHKNCLDKGLVRELEMKLLLLIVSMKDGKLTLEGLIDAMKKLFEELGL